MPSRLLKFFILSSVIFCAVLIVLKVVQSPLLDWNGRRLVASIALSLGHPVFYPIGAGPMMSGVTGPVTGYFFFPSTVFNEPDSAVMGATALAVISTLLASLFLLRSGFSKVGRWEFLGIAALFYFLALKSKALWLSLFLVHSDPVAITWSALATGLLIRWKKPTLLQLTVVFLLAALAVHSKVTFLPLFLSLLIFVAVRNGISMGVRASILELTLFALLTSIFIYAFGVKGLYENGIGPKFNWVTSLSVPSYEFAQTPLLRLKVLFSALLEINREYLFQLAFILILIALKINEFKSRHEPISKCFSMEPWVLPALTAFCMIPTALLGRIKAGGDLNTQSPVVFFLTITFCQLFWQWVRSSKNGAVYLATSLGLLALLHVTTLYSLIWPLPSLRNTKAQSAYHFAKRHPGEIYFPEYPLSNLLAEKKVYHSGAAIGEYLFITPEIIRTSFQKHLPEKLRYVAFESEKSEVILRMLPDFKYPIEIPELKNWRVFTNVASGQLPHNSGAATQE